MRLTLPFILLSFILLTAPAAAQSIESEFSNAVSLYDAGQYENAKNAFTKLVIKQEIHSRMTSSYIFLAKINNKLGNYRKAEATIESFLVKFPKSIYVDEARLTLAQTYYLQSNNDMAINILFDLILSASTEEYENIARDYAERLIFSAYSISAVERIVENMTNRTLKSFALSILGKKEMLRGRIDEGKDKFFIIIQKYSDLPEYTEAVELYNKESIYISDGGAERYVAVLLPLGDDIDYSSIKPAHQVLRGIKYACDRYNKTHTNQIGLIVENTQRNEEVINNIAENLKQLPSLYAVIGALFSDETEWTTKAFEQYDIPVISPTATSNSLQMNCSNSFQANPTFNMRGRLMAQYAYYKDKRRTMAVVYSPGGYSSDLREGFSAEFTRLGGSIVELIAYPFGAEDFTELTSPLVMHRSTLDGIYLPISDMKVGLNLLNSLRDNGISVPIYGNQDWFTVKNLHMVPSLSNQLTFTSDYYIDFEDPMYREARDDFKEITNLELNRYHLYGYDLANLVLDAVANSPFGPESFTAQLKSAAHENGIHNKITFGGSHVNKYINILRYHNGKYEFIETSRYRE